MAKTKSHATQKARDRAANEAAGVRNKAIQDLQNIILENAFKQETFMYPQKPKKTDDPENEKETTPEKVKIPTMIYFYDDGQRKRRSVGIGCGRDLMGTPRNKNGVIVNLEAEILIKLHDLLLKIQDFTSGLAEIIWDYKQERKPQWRKKFLIEMAERDVSKMKCFLSRERFNKTLANEILELVKQNTRRGVARLKKTNVLKFNPRAHYWIERESLAINEIQILYKKHLPDLRDRKVASSMAIIFAATDFWTDMQGHALRLQAYTERLKKRLRSINKEIQEARVNRRGCLYDPAGQKNRQN